MARLSEAYVQQHALRYLERRYCRFKRRQRYFSAIEVTTKKRKRADGLLVYKRWWGSAYVVSMEAKSFKTRPAIRPELDWRRWLRNCVLFFVCIALIIFLFGTYFYRSQGLFQWLVPLNFALFAAVGYGYFTRDSYRHLNVRVVAQLKQYPANEQWLAFSDDSFFSLRQKKQIALQRICRYRGIGLLLVGQNKRIDVLNEPLRRFRIGRDFVRYYTKEQSIRAMLEA